MRQKIHDGESSRAEADSATPEEACTEIEPLYFFQEQDAEEEYEENDSDQEVPSADIQKESALFVVDKRPEVHSAETEDKRDDVAAEEDDDPDILGYIDVELCEFRSNALKEAQSLDDEIVLPPPRKRQAKKSPPSTAGPGWYHLPRASEELATDIKVLSARNYLDPKRFYKKTDPISPFAVVGTVIAGKFESKSATLKKKQSKSSLATQLLADESTRSFTKRKYSQLQDSKRPRPKRAKLALAASRKRKLGRATKRR